MSTQNSWHSHLHLGLVVVFILMSIASISYGQGEEFIEDVMRGREEGFMSFLDWFSFIGKIILHVLVYSFFAIIFFIIFRCLWGGYVWYTANVFGQKTSGFMGLQQQAAAGFEIGGDQAVSFRDFIYIDELDMIGSTMKSVLPYTRIFRKFALPNPGFVRDMAYNMIDRMLKASEDVITETKIGTGISHSGLVDVREYFSGRSRFSFWNNLLLDISKKREFRYRCFDMIEIITGMRPRNTGLFWKVSGLFSMLHNRRKTSIQGTKKYYPQLLKLSLSDEQVKEVALSEARWLDNFIGSGDTPERCENSLQFDFVSLQNSKKFRLRAEMKLSQFLRYVLQPFKLFPCKTWDQTLYLLGVPDDKQLVSRIKKGYLGEQEVFVIIRAYCVAFSKKNPTDGTVSEILEKSSNTLRVLAKKQWKLLDKSVEKLDKIENSRGKIIKLVESVL